MHEEEIIKQLRAENGQKKREIELLKEYIKDLEPYLWLILSPDLQKEVPSRIRIIQPSLKLGLCYVDFGQHDRDIELLRRCLQGRTPALERPRGSGHGLSKKGDLGQARAFTSRP